MAGLCVWVTGAEGLTPGVAAKREESPLLIRATQGEQDTKAVSEDHVYFRGGYRIPGRGGPI